MFVRILCISANYTRIIRNHQGYESLIASDKSHMVKPMGISFKNVATDRMRSEGSSRVLKLQLNYLSNKHSDSLSFSLPLVYDGIIMITI